MTFRTKTQLISSSIQAVAKEETDGEPASKKAKVADDEETKMVKNTMEFVSLEKALAADWTSGMKSRFKVSISEIL